MDVPERRLRDLFDRTPANRRLGLGLESLAGDGAVVTLPVDGEALQETGIVHGGLLASVADTAAVYGLLAGLPEGQALAGIEFKMSFLRPGLAGEGPVTARSRVVRRGRTIGVAEVELSQGGRDLARGLFTYLLRERRSA